MSEDSDFSLMSHLLVLEDPRINRTKKHELIDILVIAICAAICGAETWTEIEDFGEEKESWFKEFLNLKHGIPSHDTFRRLFMLLDPSQFREVFYGWVVAVNKSLNDDHICIDGKTLRRSFNEAKKTSAIHMINAWSTGLSLSLGQFKSEGKKNEIKTIPKLLDILNIKGCLVSIDAMGCQKDIAEKIVSKGGDYLLAVKSNQEYLEKRVVEIFEQSRRPGRKVFDIEDFEDRSEGHGRVEKRRCRVITAKDGGEELGVNLLGKWPQMSSVIEMKSERTNKKTGETSEQTRYFISSGEKSSGEFFKAIRGHWEIENKLHWRLDVVMREDECRARSGHSGENFSMLRLFALNLVKSEPTKISVRRKQKKAGWGEDFLLKILLNDGRAAAN